MNKDLLSWDIEPGTLSLKISYNGRVAFSLFLGEAMEAAGREAVMEHIKEIERSTWIKGWHKPTIEYNDQTTTVNRKADGTVSIDGAFNVPL
jgi:hypothetical protein